MALRRTRPARTRPATPPPSSVAASTDPPFRRCCQPLSAAGRASTRS